MTRKIEKLKMLCECSECNTRDTLVFKSVSHARGQGSPVPEHDTRVSAPVLMVNLCMQEVGW